MCYCVCMMKQDKTNSNKDYMRFSVLIKPDLNAKIITYAEEHKWSRNFAINEILTQFLSA